MGPAPGSWGSMTYRPITFLTLFKIWVPPGEAFTYLHTFLCRPLSDLVSGLGQSSLG